MKLDILSLKTRSFWLVLLAAFGAIGIVKNLVRICANFVH